MGHVWTLKLSEQEKRLRILFLAKHARSGGVPDAADGSHAVYHHEFLQTLRSLGLQVDAADSFDDIMGVVSADFVVPLLNRAGFQNSEMLAPLLLERSGIPYLGASPIIRGLSDDKHLMKQLARVHGVPTSEWTICRRGEPLPMPSFAHSRMVVKPNASSASWGLYVADSWEAARDHVEWLHNQRYDAIVERWVPAMDVAIPVIGADGPLLLPPLLYPGSLRTYEEKRNLVKTEDDPLIPLTDPAITERLRLFSLALIRELWPFDYGRLEFRYDPETQSLWFMEVNLNCNLWSKKSISRSAALLGIDHSSLFETILVHSLSRQGLVGRRKMGLAA